MNSIPSHVDIRESMKDLHDPWDAVGLARANGHVVRLAKFSGTYHWHRHAEDELFLVVRGCITIEMRDRVAMTLREGQIGVVPKGVEHCPRSDEESFVLMFEPETLRSEGEASS